MQREKLSSRLGFILMSAGCAVGLGNVWRFPYVTGVYGGRRLLFCICFSCDSGAAYNGYGVFRRPCQRQKRGRFCFRRLKREAQNGIFTVILQWRATTFFNDVLHNDCRLDDFVFCKKWYAESLPARLWSR